MVVLKELHGMMSKWRPLVYLRLVLKPAPFNVFVGDLDSGIECTLSKFASDTKLWGAVDTLEGSNAILKNVDRLERCHEVQQGQVQGPAPGLGKS